MFRARARCILRKPRHGYGQHQRRAFFEVPMFLIPPIIDDFASYESIESSVLFENKIPVEGLFTLFRMSAAASLAISYCRHWCSNNVHTESR
ncbi:predicted protein [Sclerotinia sclerotiorum 1980 UF-70]|uniref:Uncharacterized protein n=1 Tax=Sclerotinia sclerotiorum (strain ATCC 18683 / 1980 / Ss-1) TaxID=665079 RepID=A7EKR2_SCLS1|nr:predicted protein [Sclerotinia sclerotiorum 1980 UF-70]EDO03428.1 predicted protein [Sclerotinia sclerotiorum 1980 UF-70]